MVAWIRPRRRSSSSGRCAHSSRGRGPSSRRPFGRIDRVAAQSGRAGDIAGRHRSDGRGLGVPVIGNACGSSRSSRPVGEAHAVGSVRERPSRDRRQRCASIRAMTDALRPGLSGLTPEALAAWFDERGEPAYRARQVADAVWGGATGSVDDILTLPAALRDDLEAAFRFDTVDRHGGPRGRRRADREGAPPARRRGARSNRC